MTSRIVEVHKDYINGDYVVPIPEDIMEEMGWKVGDVLEVEYVNGLIKVAKSDE